jgi:predicted anti-sigma-YlaC factor YlaD
MGCPYTHGYWEQDINTADPRVAEHLASCAACRAELARQEMLRGLFAALPEIDAPAAVVQRLQTPVADELTCAQTLDLLEAWREGDLDAHRAFLVEDHLLWCADCRMALAQAAQLGALLHALPDEYVPLAVAERLDAARRPWWERFLAPVWQYGMAAAAVVLMFTLALFDITAPVAPLAQKAAPTAVAEQPSWSAAPLAQPRVTYAQPVARPRVTVRLGDKPAVNATTPVPTAPKPAVAATAMKSARPVAHPAVTEIFTAYRPALRDMVIPVHADVPHAAPAESAVKPVETQIPEFKASARDAMMRMTREAELASVEESLSNAPEVMVASVPRRRPEVVDFAAPAVTDAPADAHVARMEELRKALIEDIRRTPSSQPKPIVVRNETTEKHADGVLFRIQ